jgi:arylsulfatase A-like enzyme
MQTRRAFIQKSAMAGALAALAPKLSAQSRPKGLAKAPRRPNVLFLWTDQHRADVMPYATKSLRAPHFAKLSEQSFCFTRAYCTQPVCTPSRGSILTGLYPHTHGAVQNNIPLKRETKTFAEYVSGYRTAYYGKWHLGDEISAQHGFADWRSIEDYYRAYYTKPADKERFSDYHRFLVGKGFPPDAKDPVSGAAVFSRTMAAALPEHLTKCAFLADEAVQFLRKRDRGEPFMLSVNTLEPHSPTYGPLNEVHDPAQVHSGPAFAQPVEPTASRLHRKRHEAVVRGGYKNHPTRTESDWRRLRANYYGLVTMVDTAFGRILKALEETGEADNTIIVYTSDHGDMCGDHSMMRKEVFYEGATNIPLMVHVPWLNRDRVMIDAPISQVDLAPTILSLLGASDGGAMQGRSRLDWLENRRATNAQAIVVEWTDAEDNRDDGRSVITPGGLKLNVYRGDAPELYDLKSDPGELRNVANDPSRRETIRSLIAELRTWQRETNDTLAFQT